MGLMSEVGWEELAGRTLARQFPAGLAGVAATIEAIGPIQSQTARSPYLALAARLPGVTRDAIHAAYDDYRIVRGSTIRGTVHTSTPDDHVLLEVATRVGLRAMWQRTLRPRDVTLEQVWAGIEEFARDEWRIPDELVAHVVRWLEAHDAGHQSRLDGIAGRALCFGHGGLLRRPLSGGWEGQGKAGYRSAAAILGDRSAVLADPDAALDRLVRRHLAAYGPASRRDLAWWAGTGLRAVDAALARQTDLVELTSPDGLLCYDLPGAPGPVQLPGVRLLPEFDALLCAFDPPARMRFIDPEHYAVIWQQVNGLLLAPLLVDGRLTGHWRLSKGGSGAAREAEVTWFAGTRRPRKSEIEEALANIETAYGVHITGLRLDRG